MRTLLIIDTAKLIKSLSRPNYSYISEESGDQIDLTRTFGGRGGRPIHISLPKQIKILPEVAGLFVGEGFFGRSIVFANSNEAAVEEVLEFLRQFNFPVKAYLEISTKDAQNSFVDKCLEFWHKQIDVEISRVRQRREFSNTTKHGTIHLIVNNSILSEVLDELIRQIKAKAENKKQISIGYLKGIIAAEGNINVKKTTGCVYMVRISAKKESERRHYKRCLERAGIKIFCKDMPTISGEEGIRMGWKTTSGRAGAVIISRWDNFIKIAELGLLDLSEDKKTKFSSYMLNNMFTKQFLEFSHFRHKDFTMKQAQEYFGFSGRKVNRLLTMWKWGYANRKTMGKHHIYRLNKSYESVFSLLQSLNKSDRPLASPLVERNL